VVVGGGGNIYASAGTIIGNSPRTWASEGLKLFRIFSEIRSDHMVETTYCRNSNQKSDAGQHAALARDARAEM